jgi:hypothetical protein
LSRARIVRDFPRFKSVQFYLTSPADPSYNCIAWAVGDTSRWWWPDKNPYTYWPGEIPRNVQLDSFIALFESLGYQPCPDASVETHCEKVAIFVDAAGKPTHAARQLETGQWTSKIGRLEDISHTIYGLEGGGYGDVAVYLRRFRFSG